MYFLFLDQGYNYRTEYKGIDLENTEFSPPHLVLSFNFLLLSVSLTLVLNRVPLAPKAIRVRNSSTDLAQPWTLEISIEQFSKVMRWAVHSNPPLTFKKAEILPSSFSFLNQMGTNIANIKPESLEKKSVSKYQLDFQSLCTWKCSLFWSLS